MDESRRQLDAAAAHSLRHPSHQTPEAGQGDALAGGAAGPVTAAVALSMLEGLLYGPPAGDAEPHPDEIAAHVALSALRARIADLEARLINATSANVRGAATPTRIVGMVDGTVVDLNELEAGPWGGRIGPGPSVIVLPLPSSETAQRDAEVITEEVNRYADAHDAERPFIVFVDGYA